MYVCYGDESYTNENEISCVAGIRVNTHSIKKVHRQQNTFRDLANDILDEHGEGGDLEEFKAQHLYKGEGAWNGVPGEVRHEFMESILRRITEENLKIIPSVINREKFEETQYGQNHHFLTIQYVHLVLSHQREAAEFESFKTKPDKIVGSGGNKGVCFFVFDRLDNRKGAITQFLTERRHLVHEYYDREFPEDQFLPDLWEVPLFADSHYSEFVQLADLTAYIIRTYALLEEGLIDPSYKIPDEYEGIPLFENDETDRFEKWYNILSESFLSSPDVVRKQTSNAPLADTLREIRPKSTIY